MLASESVVQRLLSALSMLCRRIGLRFVLSEGFIDGYTLVLGLTLCLLTFNSFMMCEMFEILGVGVGLFGLCLRGGVVLLCAGLVWKEKRYWTTRTLVMQEELCTSSIE